MWKLRIGVFVTSGLVALGAGGAAWASSGGDANAGDVWVDNVGQAPGPGHEMDPHLACQDINLWGSGLADPSGSFTIDGWAPSGSQESLYNGTWNYHSASDPIAVISYSTLIDAAKKAGDTPAAKGFHFKLQFSQDPQKHKTFWLNCDPSTSGGGGNTGGGGDNNGGGGDNNNGGGTTSGGGGTTNTPPVTTTTTPVKTSIGATTATRHKAKKHKRHRKLKRRHRKVHRRHVRVKLPPFTG